MFPIINIGPLSIPAAPMLLLIGFYLGSSFAESRAAKRGRDAEALGKIIWYALLAGIVGARLSFIARNPFAFQGELLTIFSLNPALLDISGGLLISIGVAYFVSSRFGFSLRETADDLVPFLAVLIPAIYLAKFASGSGFGTLSDLPWAVEVWGGSRHPVQLYFFLAGSIVLLLVWFNQMLSWSTEGGRFTSFLIMTSFYLSFFYSFQDPAGLILGGFRVKQLIAWLVMSLAIYITLRFRTVNPRQGS